MQYPEFCQGVDDVVSVDLFEKAEAVYMAFDRFQTKESIYAFFKLYGAEGINTLYFKLDEISAIRAQALKVGHELAEAIMLYGISFDHVGGK